MFGNIDGHQITVYGEKLDTSYGVTRITHCNEYNKINMLTV